MNIRLATAPVSWGVLLKDTPNVPPWHQVLAEMQQSGYVGTELGPYGFLPLDKDLLQETLDKHGLTLLSAYVQIYFANPDFNPESYQETVTTAKFLSEMGCEWIVLSDLLLVDENRSKRAGRIRPEDGLQGDDWKAFVKNVDEFAQRALDEWGLKSAFHPHVGAFIETEAEVNRLMEETNPDVVGLCLDTAHLMYGGSDPVELTRKWGSRVNYLHLKECDGDKLQQVRDNEWDYFKGVEIGVFPEIGQGSVDFAGLLDVLKDINFDGWAIIEQDIIADDPNVNAMESAIRNREYLENLGYR